MLQPSNILPVIGDAITFVGHPSWPPCRERNFSKPDIAIAYQSVCSNPVLFQLISLEIYELSKHIKYIGEVNEIAKTMVRFSFVRRITDYKNNRGNFKCS